MIFLKYLLNQSNSLHESRECLLISAGLHPSNSTENSLATKSNAGTRKMTRNSTCVRKMEASSRPPSTIIRLVLLCLTNPTTLRFKLSLKWATDRKRRLCWCRRLKKHLFHSYSSLLSILYGWLIWISISH